MESEKVLQTILHGSVYEGIYSNFITYDDVLNFLLDNKAKDEDEKKKFNIAYSILCNLSHSQYIGGKHFIILTNDTDYIGLYFLINYGRGMRLETKEADIAVRRKCENIQIELFRKEKYSFLYLTRRLCLNLFHFNFLLFMLKYIYLELVVLVIGEVA